MSVTQAQSHMSPKVDTYLSKAKKWPEEIWQLRAILLDCQLTEELKWAKPCYTFDGKNIVSILPLKEYCVLLFFKGGLLNDTDNILIRPSENTQAMRQLRFTSVPQIAEMESILKSYICNAIEVEKTGMKVSFKKITEYIVPDELQHKLDQMPAFNAAFNALTPGRQRAYLIYFSAAKQSKTRESRVEKCLPQILSGRGLND